LVIIISIKKIVEIIPKQVEIKVLIDVNNVCHNGQNKPKLINFLQVLEQLIKEIKILPENIFSICDPNLRFIIDDRKEFERLLRNGTVFISPKIADEFILLLAQKFEFCFIVSNDKFRQYSEQIPDRNWLKIRKISFMVMKGYVCLSPDIDYDEHELLLENLGVENIPEVKTTLDVLEDIEKTEGELDFY